MSISSHITVTSQSETASEHNQFLRACHTDPIIHISADTSFPRVTKLFIAKIVASYNFSNNLIRGNLSLKKTKGKKTPQAFSHFSTGNINAASTKETSKLAVFSFIIHITASTISHVTASQHIAAKSFQTSAWQVTRVQLPSQSKQTTQVKCTRQVGASVRNMHVESTVP